MNTYELNKFAGAALGSLLFIFALNLIGDMLIAPAELAEPAYKAGAADDAAPSKAAEAPARPAGEPLPALLAKASAESGEKAAKKCALCHTFDKGGAQKVGPNLWGALGGKKARVDGFDYSNPMKSKGGNWGIEEMDAYLANPKGYVPGTKMAFAGVNSAKERADLILYLRRQSDNPIALPAP